MASFELRDKLFNMLRSPTGMMERAGRALHIQEHLKRLSGHLWAINAVIVDAELRADLKKERDDQAHAWVAEVLDAIADVEELLLEILQAWQDHYQQASRAAATATAVGIAAFRRLAVVRKFKKLESRLNELVQKGSALDLWKEMMNSMDPCQDEYSNILRDEVVGRDTDINNIIEILQQQQQQPPSDGSSPPFFLLVKGVREIQRGTTTVARMIYHHRWVRQHFQHRVWVDVSIYFKIDPIMEPIKIATEIAELITGDPCGGDDLQAIWSLINERLGGRRYLLVLNDVTIGRPLEKDRWDQLHQILLRVGAPGSTVIIAGFGYRPFGMPASAKVYELEGLAEDDCIKLFLRHASILQPCEDENKDKAPSTSMPPSLISFAKYCYAWRGSPLDAKIMGSICRYTQVDQISYSDSYKYMVGNQHFASMFFNHARRTSARRDLFCLLLPSVDCGFDVGDLFHMLQVQGLLPHYSSDKKLRMQFVEGIVKIQHDSAFFYNIMRRSITQTYCTLKLVGQDPKTIPRQCLHLFLHVDDDSTASWTLPMAAFSRIKNNKLRTLIVHKTKEKAFDDNKRQIVENISEGMFANLIHIRILHLRATRIHRLPDVVGRLRKLRYLNLSQTQIQALPAPIKKLRNLQILNLAGCERLQKLPGWIRKLGKLQVLKLARCTKLRVLPTSVIELVNLQELDLEGCPFLIELPQGLSNMNKLTDLNVLGCVSFTRIPREIGQLTNLQTLSGYLAADDLGYAIPELQALTNFTKLYLVNLERVEDTQNFTWKEMRKLEDLGLRWQWWDMDHAEPVSKASSLLQVDEDFPPNLALKKLEIISYTGKGIPSWMTITRERYPNSLVEIRLINLRRCERLPPLGELPCLEIVEISGMDLVSVVDEAFYGDSGTFPSLETLTFSEMPILEKWQSVERNNLLFKRLKELTVIQCPKLQVLDVERWGLSLRIWMNSEILSSTSKFVSWQNLRYIDKLEIIGCQELRRLPLGMRQLELIEELKIIRCDRLESLPVWLTRFKKTFYLYISGCRSLSFIPGEVIQRMGSRLIIEGCPKLVWQL